MVVFNDDIGDTAGKGGVLESQNDDIRFIDDDYLLNADGEDAGLMRDYDKILEENDYLKKEIQYRVRSNLAIINGVMNLEISSCDDERIKGILQDSMSRIISMSFAYENIYNSDDISVFDMENFIRNLSHSFIEYYSPDSVISINVDTKGLGIIADDSVSFALVINDLFIISLKHSLCGRSSGRIGIKSVRSDDGFVRIVFSDDGSGQGAGFDIKTSKLPEVCTVKSLVERYFEGELNYNFAGNPEWEIVIPESKFNSS
ncbi:sensor histidine kinase [Methanochimaera problematica]|nr:histidine kinase dimerization/phosphoacceptor domain -containing protein [Methanoplanus sp. FWC-SCC4]